MTKFAYNKDNDLRMSILLDGNWTKTQKNIIKKNGGVYYFNIPYSVLEKLIDNNFVDLTEQQNNSLTIQDFIDFTKKYPEIDFGFSGFAIEPEREDYSIIINGLNASISNKYCHDDFYNTFSNADVLEISDEYIEAWYD